MSKQKVHRLGGVNEAPELETSKQERAVAVADRPERSQGQASSGREIEAPSEAKGQVDDLEAGGPAELTLEEWLGVRHLKDVISMAANYKRGEAVGASAVRELLGIGLGDVSVRQAELPDMLIKAGRDAQDELRRLAQRDASVMHDFSPIRQRWIDEKLRERALYQEIATLEAGTVKDRIKANQLRQKMGENQAQREARKLLTEAMLGDVSTFGPQQLEDIQAALTVLGVTAEQFANLETDYQRLVSSVKAAPSPEEVQKLYAAASEEKDRLENEIKELQAKLRGFLAEAHAASERSSAVVRALNKFVHWSGICNTDKLIDAAAVTQQQRQQAGIVAAAVDD